MSIRIDLFIYVNKIIYINCTIKINVTIYILAAYGKAPLGDIDKGTKDITIT